jgi:hypothetical protein
MAAPHIGHLCALAHERRGGRDSELIRPHTGWVSPSPLPAFYRYDPHLRQSFSSFTVSAFQRLLVVTRMRVGELTGLEVRDVSGAATQIRVEGNSTNGNGSELRDTARRAQRPDPLQSSQS